MNPTIEQQIETIIGEVSNFATILEAEKQKIISGVATRGRSARSESARIAKLLKEFRALTVQNEKAVSGARKESK